jgi:hypothetical protein
MSLDISFNAGIGIDGLSIGADISTGTFSDGTFNISAFRSQIDSLGGVLRTNHFQVQIGVPPFLQSSVVNVETLSFFCKATTLPGIALVTKNVQRYGYGPLQKMPMGFENPEITLNFIADASGVILNFFNDWLRSAVEVSSDQGPNSPPMSRPNNSAPMLPWFVNYKENYQTDIAINIFDSAGNVAYTVNLNEAFPVAVGDIYVDWGDEDHYMIVPVKFNFTDTFYSTTGFFPDLTGILATGLSYTESFIGGVVASSTIASTIDNTTSNLGFPTNNSDNQTISI